MMTPMFKGIPADAFDFFEELAADNTKLWWTANKDRYESNVRGPVEALFAEVASEFGPAKIFRPYRDVRFSHDKTPYKTNLGGTASGNDGSVWYLALDANGMYVGSGYYRMAKDQIAAYREAVAHDETGPKLADILTTAENAGYEVGGEELKRVPPGFDRDHPRGALLKHKGLYLGRQLEPAAWMGTMRAAERITKIWRDLKPVNAWFHANVGPTKIEW